MESVDQSFDNIAINLLKRKRVKGIEPSCVAWKVMSLLAEKWNCSRKCIAEVCRSRLGMLRSPFFLPKERAKPTGLEPVSSHVYNFLQEAEIRA
jgi:hypothetical protein